MHTLCLLGEEIILFFGLSTIPVYLHDDHINYNLFLMYILLLWHNTITVVRYVVQVYRRRGEPQSNQN